MRRSFLTRMAIVLAASALIAAGASGESLAKGKPKAKGGGPPPHAQAGKNLGIPPGHLPPPGECRIWLPGRPPGHQPPPGKCSRLKREVPVGAWLLHTPGGRPEEVRVAVYHPERERFVLEFRYYEAATGLFLRFETGD